MIVLIEWGCHSIEVITCLMIGALLMYWWMDRRLDRSVAAAHRYADARLTKQQRRSAHSFNLLASDYSDIRDDLRQAVVICERLAAERERLAGHIAQLSAENNILHHRLAQTPGIVNAWGPKTERGQA